MFMGCEQLSMGQSRSGSTTWASETPRGDFRDTVHRSGFSKLSLVTHTRVATSPQSSNTYSDSAVSSISDSPSSSSRPSPPSSATSANIIVDIPQDQKVISLSRGSSILTRLKSSISSSGVSPHSARRSSVQPSDFLFPPEEPEKRFVDSIGMVIPGVCDRSRCALSSAHFITNWRLSEPVEYTTALADHGITYSDYNRLLVALANFLEEISNKSNRSSIRATSHGQAAIPKNNSISESAHQYKVVLERAMALNKLLEEISWNWQKRGLPVMVCVSSYSLFSPNCVSESFIQILHKSLQTPTPPESPILTQLSFIDPSVANKSGESSAVELRHEIRRRSVSPPLPTAGNLLHHHQQFQSRDRTRPWSLWPNAIPSRKRELMKGYAHCYGLDPYFRAWMRADINSRTKCTSYAKYMIEQEDNPFINTRLDYVTPPSRRTLLRNLLTMRSTKWGGEHSSNTNRAYYEHNRKLECRKSFEHGCRLRVVSFGFRHPIYPPHTPEMAQLSLKLEAYQTIIDRIEGIRQDYTASVKRCLLQCPSKWYKLRHRRTEDALARVSGYIRQLNAVDRRIVWTIEKIPGVYDRGLAEWEISAWNGEDPLELLIQLEKWRIIERKLDIDDDEY
jgi:hypothetical protein